jgi:hypothetical protein
MIAAVQSKLLPLSVGSSSETKVEQLNDGSPRIGKVRRSEGNLSVDKFRNFTLMHGFNIIF